MAKAFNPLLSLPFYTSQHLWSIFEVFVWFFLGNDHAYVNFSCPSMSPVRFKCCSWYVIWFPWDYSRGQIDVCLPLLNQLACDISYCWQFSIPFLNELHVVGTISKGAALLHQEGAREVYACCTHAVFRYQLPLKRFIFFVYLSRCMSWLFAVFTSIQR